MGLAVDGAATTVAGTVEMMVGIGEGMMEEVLVVVMMAALAAMVVMAVLGFKSVTARA